MNKRLTENFDSGWKFLMLTEKNGLSELKVEVPNYDDSMWENVTIPHTWNDSDTCDGKSEIEEGGEKYYRGLGGYRKKQFFSSERYSGKKFILNLKARTPLPSFLSTEILQVFTKADTRHSDSISPSL